jgi:two-component system LytT family response regulator
MLKAIIIDDEISCVELLQLSLSKYCPDVEVLDCCSSAQEGIESIAVHRPDVVLLDIDMPQKNGFEMLLEIGQPKFRVIFVTAHEQFALKAFKHDALDYLLKPVNANDLVLAIDKAKRAKERGSLNDKIQLVMEQIELLSDEQKKRRVTLSTADGFIFVDVDDIIYCVSERNYTRIFLTEGKSVLVAKTLKLVEELISSNDFLRIHHSYLINIENVKTIKKDDGGYIVMLNNDQIPIAKSKRDELARRFPRI